MFSHAYIDLIVAIYFSYDRVDLTVIIYYDWF